MGASDSTYLLRTSTLRRLRTRRPSANPSFAREYRISARRRERRHPPRQETKGDDDEGGIDLRRGGERRRAIRRSDAHVGSLRTLQDAGGVQNRRGHEALVVHVF